MSFPIRSAITNLLFLVSAASPIAAQGIPIQFLGTTDQLPDDLVGIACSVSGGQAIVGGTGHDHLGVVLTGGAWVFERGASGVWTQTAELVPTDLATQDQFGNAVAITSDRALVGCALDDDLGSSSGSAYIFERQPNGT